MKFYAGQKVKITDCTCGHGFNIGAVVIIDSADEVSDGSWDLCADNWIFDEDDCEPVEEKKLTGAHIAELIYQWANDNRIHPDDFSMLFAEELLERLEADK
jgi:hypothetical protein